MPSASTSDMCRIWSYTASKAFTSPSQFFVHPATTSSVVVERCLFIVSTSVARGQFGFALLKKSAHLGRILAPLRIRLMLRSLVTDLCRFDQINGNRSVLLEKRGELLPGVTSNHSDGGSMESRAKRKLALEFTRDIPSEQTAVP